MQNNFHGTKGASYHCATGFKSWESAKHAVDICFEGNKPEKLKFLEIHGHCPSFMSLRQIMNQWRQLAMQQNTKFFLFSLARDPIPFIFSQFNDHCANRKHCTRSKQVPSIDEFLKMEWVNRETNYFIDGRGGDF